MSSLALAKTGAMTLVLGLLLVVLGAFGRLPEGDVTLLLFASAPFFLVGFGLLMVGVAGGMSQPPNRIPPVWKV